MASSGISQLRQELGKIFAREARSHLEASPARREGSVEPVLAWLPLAKIRPNEDGPEIMVGFSERSTIVVRASDGSVTDVDSNQFFLPLYPLLELPYLSVRQLLADELKRRGIDSKFLDVFPFGGLVTAALRSDSKFWPDLALRCLDELAPDETVKGALEHLLQHGKTQRQRHQAMKVLRRT